jgi:hypothetical protein
MYIDILREPNSERSIIFHNFEAALSFVTRMGLLQTEKSCVSCGRRMNLNVTTNIKSQRSFRCSNHSCNKRISIFSGLNVSFSNMSLEILFLAVYKFLENVEEINAIRNLNVSKNCYFKIKSILRKYIYNEYINKSIVKLGENGNPIQVDETAIARGKLLECPSVLSDDTSGITWLVGFIEENTNRFYYEIVENRSAETMKNLFKKYVGLNSVVKIDGHRSYPSAVACISGVHIVVNHSNGFKNEEGFHTNLIENFWSKLKYEIGKRKGVKRSYLGFFLAEFWWRQCNLPSKSVEELQQEFVK